MEPNLNELRVLADFFRVDLRDLLPPDPRHQSVGLLFRSGGKDVDEVTSSALSRRVSYSIELLGEQLVPSAVTWIDKFRREGKTYADAEHNAEVFRTVFLGGDQVSPLYRLPELAVREMGVLLFLVRSNRFEGASAYVESLPFVFLAESFGPRMLFTLAHEIGHLIGHHDPQQSFAVVDTQTEKRTLPSKNATEFYAHAFASCLLMPGSGIGITLRKIREMQKGSDKALGDLEILLLSRIYGVSFYAAARRCEDLNLLPKGGAASLNETLKKEFGSAEKRADAANLPPRADVLFPKMPPALLKAATDKVRAGEISIGKASSILGLSIADLLTANAPRMN
ncbi:MAG TPA: ImmA/IrrE family metallo-endopeptidase [Candidatus Dormibacteraeota bacterium]|nr:ImmA/IrrE family metallo-endopeptidase [Candidatus Dormibacteraeota bacterium]